MEKIRNVLYKDQKQSFADVLENSCYQRFHKFDRKTPVLESLFNKDDAGLKAKKSAIFLKRDPTQVFFCKISGIFKGTFSSGTLSVVVSNMKQSSWFLVIISFVHLQKITE